ncbi:hypothetical protein BHC62_14740 [Pseudomonas sp. 06C 126]|nr:hypothetical protein BHC62_14740 [Pseudomonas sp. 06C 126]
MPQYRHLDIAEVVEICVNPRTGQHVMHINSKLLEPREIAYIGGTGLKFIGLLSPTTHPCGNTKVGLIFTQPLAFLSQALAYP